VLVDHAGADYAFRLRVAYMAANFGDQHPAASSSRQRATHSLSVVASIGTYRRGGSRSIAARRSPPRTYAAFDEVDQERRAKRPDGNRDRSIIE
jgi:hypothetical protein